MKLSKKQRQRAVPLAVTVLVLVLAVVFHRPLWAWFSGEPMGEASATTHANAGALSVDARIQPDPPRQQDNTLLLEVKGPEGKPVEKADVKVVYSMPAMGAMPEMKGDAKVTPKGDGTYAAEFDLPMGGTWTLETSIGSDQGTGSARYTMTVGSKGLTPVGSGGGGAKAAMDMSQAEELPPAQLPQGAFENVQAAFVSYDRVRALLAADETEGLGPVAEHLAASLEQALAAFDDAPPQVKDCLKQGMETAKQIGSASGLEQARKHFGELSQLLVALGGADPRLQKGWNVFKCPMAEGFQRWIQKGKRLENPYMGPKMLACGSRSDWTPAPPAQAAGAHAHGNGEIAYYTCGMHPSVKQSGPGTCPICAMDLTPVTKEEVESGIIFVDEVRRQRIGVKTAEAQVKPLELSIRAVGKVTYDETKLEDVTLRVKGWIQDLKVDETGQQVKKGDVLFTLYGPELYAAQQEYLLALGSQKRAADSAAPGRSDSLVRASKQRLKLWGLSEGQIAVIARRGDPIENMPFLSPATGYVIEKNVVAGAAVEPGEKLFRIAPLDRVWVEADVYESDLQHVKKGDKAIVTLPYVQGKKFEGKVTHIFPFLEGKTRTGRVRVELENADLELKPDMYANVSLQKEQGERLVIPSEAVIYTGPRRLVFVDLGEGRLKPVEVELGIETDEYAEVTDGLEPGDTVVTSGNFLVAAESRIRSAADYWSGGEE
jgi:Cu(I)/Ag(I) efflux system membrane fusion protein